MRISRKFWFYVGVQILILSGLVFGIQCFKGLWFTHQPMNSQACNPLLMGL